MRLPVSVVGPHGGNLGKTTTDSLGLAEFCDVGLQRVEVRVGDDSECGQIRILNVLPRFGDTIFMPVIFTGCIRHEPVYIKSCLLLLRVQSTDGKRLSGARVIAPNTEFERRTDSFGRVFVFFSLHTQAHLFVTHDTYKSSSVEANCERESDRIERTLLLERVP